MLLLPAAERDLSERDPPGAAPCFAESISGRGRTARGRLGARHAVGFARRNGIFDCDGWFVRNAKAAWERRDLRGLMGQDWAAPTDASRPPAPSGPDARGPAAWDAAATVVLLQALAARRTDARRRPPHRRTEAASRPT